MKVCVFGLRGFPDIQGGAEKHCEALYTSFPEESDVEFIIFRRKPYITGNAAFSGIRFIDLPSTRIKGVEAFLHSFLAACRTIAVRPDVVHIHNIGPAVFVPLLRIFGLRVVVTYHSPNYEHSKWSAFGRTVLRFGERVTFRYASKVIFVNSFQMEKAPRKYSDKYVFIPNGIPDGIQPAECFDAIAPFGLEPGKYILAMGRITPEKGFDILVQSFSKAAPEGLKLCIAGGVEAEKGYFETLKRNMPAQTVFPGYVSGELLRQLYSHARAFVLSSRNEGFPLVLLEAMAYGRRIIASDIPASHLVDLPGECYYPSGDVQTLASMITKVEEQPYTTIKYDLSRFSWGKIAGEVLSIYNNICNIYSK